MRELADMDRTPWTKLLVLALRMRALRWDSAGHVAGVAHDVLVKNCPEATRQSTQATGMVRHVKTHVPEKWDDFVNKRVRNATCDAHKRLDDVCSGLWKLTTTCTKTRR